MDYPRPKTRGKIPKHFVLAFREGQRRHMKVYGMTREAAKREIHRKIALAEERMVDYMLSVHVCPVCGGTGNVPCGFYDSTNPVWVTTATIPETCRSCAGKGIVWKETPCDSRYGACE